MVRMESTALSWGPHTFDLSIKGKSLVPVLLSAMKKAMRGLYWNCICFILVLNLS